MTDTYEIASLGVPVSFVLLMEFTVSCFGASTCLVKKISVTVRKTIKTISSEEDKLTYEKGRGRGGAMLENVMPFFTMCSISMHRLNDRRLPLL